MYRQPLRLAQRLSIRNSYRSGADPICDLADLARLRQRKVRALVSSPSSRLSGLPDVPDGLAIRIEGKQAQFSSFGGCRRSFFVFQKAIGACVARSWACASCLNDRLAFHAPSVTQATASTMQENQEISIQELKKAVKDIVPAMTGDKSKGQAGMIGVIGGCREYTGAPYFSAISVLKIGADLSHVFCTEGAANVIKSYSPELIVHPYLPDSHDLVKGESHEQKVKEAVGQIQHWADRFDVMVIGPGLGRDELVHNAVKQVITYLREKRKPMVIDADGLYITTRNLDLVQGYDQAILTPNKNEFQRLADQMGVPLEGEGSPGDPLLDITKRLKGPIVIRKGAQDRICNGSLTVSNGEGGSKRRAGGQGDVLSGSLAVMVAWALEYVAEKAGKADFPHNLSPLMIASYGGSLVARFAQQAAFEKHRRSMLAEDVINELGDTVDKLFT